jgi:glycosyltransferase involved in cell wall biosynthesis
METICFISPEFVTHDYFSGGLANYVNRASLELAKRGARVIIVTRGNENKYELDNAREIHYVKSGRLRILVKRIFGKRFSSFALQIDFAWLAYRKILSQKISKPFYIQAANFRFVGLFCTLSPKLRPYTITRISSYRPLWNFYAMAEKTLESRFIEYLEELQLRYSSKIYAPSALLATKINQVTGRHCEVIPTPFFNEITIQDDQFVGSLGLNDKIYLLYIGRLIPHKGVHILSEALPEVLDLFPGIMVVFAGEDTNTWQGGSMKKKIISDNLRFKKQLMFTGQLRHDKLYPLIEKAKLVILPSLIDNMPNALLESMYFGKVVIGTIGASFDEVIEDGKTGYLVERNNVKALSNKIVEALNSDNFSIEHAAKAKIKEFRAEVIIDRLIEFYRKNQKTKTHE